MFQQASFNSFEFIFLFLPCFLIGFHLLKKSGNSNYSHYWLIICSLLFYSWGNLSNLPILLFSLVFNYTIAQFIGPIDTQSSLRPGNLSRKFFFILGIVLNVLFLSYYKYFSYLPLGISFFTTIQILYLIDCYEGMLKPSTLREHALVVSFFPTVTMGPIIRVKSVLTQFQETANKGISLEQLVPGLALLSIGLFKKVVIADSFAIIADIGFTSASALSTVMAWVISLSYTMQVYFDFSGYSDAAIGIAMMIGIYIPANFNSPYQALSIIEFWQRWHISLTTFITTYVYTPIVRSFKKITFQKAMLATLIAMIIVGVWHGSTINFFIFGFLHGVALIINNYWQKKIKIKLPNFLAWFLTFIFLNFTFVIFRADSFWDAIQILTSMFNLNLMDYESVYTTNEIARIVGETFNLKTSELVQLGANKMAIPPMIIGVSLLIFAKRNSNQIIKEFNPTLINLIGFLILAIISMIYLNSNFSQEYIYNDF